MHIDHRVVAHALSNRTIRGASIQVLTRCVLLATKYDIDLEIHWISTKENALADALSRFDYDRIADIAPQLVHANNNLRRHGFRTYANRDSPK